MNTGKQFGLRNVAIAIWAFAVLVDAMDRKHPPPLIMEQKIPPPPPPLSMPDPVSDRLPPPPLRQREQEQVLLLGKDPPRRLPPPPPPPPMEEKAGRKIHEPSKDMDIDNNGESVQDVVNVEILRRPPPPTNVIDNTNTNTSPLSKKYAIPPLIPIRSPLSTDLYHSQQSHQQPLTQHRPPPQQMYNQQEHSITSNGSNNLQQSLPRNNLNGPSNLQRISRPPPLQPYSRGPPPSGYRQQQGPPPRQQRPQQQQQQPSPSLLKSLWQRVEQGLDVLSDLEGVVTDRASQLMSKPASVVAARANQLLSVTKATIPKSNPIGRPIATTPEKVRTPSKATSSSLASSSSSASLVPPRSFGNKFEVAKQQKAREMVHRKTTRNVDWDQLQSSRTMMQTNGGASHQPESRRDHNLLSPTKISGPPPVRRPTMFDEEEEDSLWAKIAGRLPKLPTLPTMPLSKFLGRGSDSFRRMSRETMDAWNAEDGVAHRHKQQVEQVRRGDKTSTTPPIADMLVRSNHGRSPGLLLNQNIAQCQSIGRSKAMLDVACLAFLLCGFHAMLPAFQAISLPSSTEDLFLSLLPAVGSAMVASIDTWSSYAIVAAILTAFTNHVLFRGAIRSLCNNVGNAVKSDTQYCQLYMRLVQATPVEKVTQERLQVAAECQVIGAIHVARLKYFVDLVLTTLVIMTVSILRPIATTLVRGVAEMVAMKDWTVWPLPWSSLWEKVLGIVRPVGETMKDLVISEVNNIVDHPMKAAFQVATFGALVLMTVLPSIEQKRIVTQAKHGHDEDSDELAPFSFGTVKTLSNLGVSSASRLGLLSKSGALEGTLERWRTSIPKPMASISSSSISTVFRMFSYAIASGVIVVAPIVVYAFNGPANPSILSLATALMRWDSVLDVSILLLFTSRLSWRAISTSVASSTRKLDVSRFVHDLAAAVDEVSSSNRAGMSKLGTSMSPLNGLSVKDLWSAHTAKRAWSVRGANLECPAGQVLVILGEEGSGKTRMLTSVAEAIVSPAKRSLTSTKVRGVVSVGGLDATKWDRSELKKRLGLFLNDVRTISDNAEFMSGFTLEEILEPMDGLLRSQSPGTRGRSAMNMALEITGLSTSLLPRLPAKLSTVVSANEDELTPSPTRPRCSPLSPSEWSKLLLARVLAQTIYDNDNSSRSSSSENSLLGSLLILDDVTAYMSEVDEARTLMALRRTGAATVLTSHKWATGRFADQIVIMKDGAIIESGTHTDLLSRGPQQSIYAQKWYTMTTAL